MIQIEEMWMNWHVSKWEIDVHAGDVSEVEHKNMSLQVLLIYAKNGKTEYS